MLHLHHSGISSSHPRPLPPYNQHTPTIFLLASTSASTSALLHFTLRGPTTTAGDKTAFPWRRHLFPFPILRFSFPHVPHKHYFRTSARYRTARTTLFFGSLVFLLANFHAIAKPCVLPGRLLGQMSRIPRAVAAAFPDQAECSRIFCGGSVFAQNRDGNSDTNGVHHIARTRLTPRANRYPKRRMLCGYKKMQEKKRQE